MDELLHQMEDYPCVEGEESVTQEMSRGSFSWVWLVAAAMLIIVPLAVWYGTHRKGEGKSQ